MTGTGSLVNLAARRLGAGVIAASDEFFGEKENLLRPGPPAARPGTFGHKGQVVDGWETRRRRVSQPSPITAARPGAIMFSGGE